MPRRRPSPTVLVGLQYRDRFSVGEERIRLGLQAFHWSIIIDMHDPAGACFHRFDVTDGMILDLDGKDSNPERVWVYRHQQSDSLEGIVRYTGAVRLGSVQSSRSATSVDGLDSFFKAVPVPLPTNRAEHNCVSWTADALKALLDTKRLGRTFDVDEMMRFGLAHADARIKDWNGTPDIVEYLPLKPKKGALAKMSGLLKLRKPSSTG